MSIPTDAIIGICSTILGTILGWLLNSFSNRSGNIQFTTVDSYCRVDYRDCYKSDGNGGIEKLPDKELESIYVSFTLLATNKKMIRSGINNCKVYILCDSRKYEILDWSQENDNINELDALLNIDGNSTREVRYKQREFICRDKDIEKKGYEVWLEYNVNGNRRKRKYLVTKQKKLTTSTIIDGNEHVNVKKACEENEEQRETDNILERIGFNAGEPTQEVIEYIEKIQTMTQGKNFLPFGRCILFLAMFLSVIMAAVQISTMIVVFSIRNIIALMVTIILLIAIAWLLKNEPKEKLNYYNLFMGIISVLSLFLAIISSGECVVNFINQVANIINSI